MLKGQELLARVKELDGASKSELVASCGYVTKKKDGGDRLNYTAFYEALLEAKGMAFGAPSGNGRRGRSLGHICRVQFNGNLLVGKAYVLPQGFAPGDEFEIRHRRGGGFSLVPLGSGEEGGETDEGKVEGAEPAEEQEQDVEGDEEADVEVRDISRPAAGPAAGPEVLQPAAAQRELAGAGALVS